MVEYGWDQTPTPDLGLDITKAPSDIQKLYKWVIEKMYGKDVASAYGQGLIAAGIIAKNAEAMALFTSGQMDTLDTFVKGALIELTDKDVISAPEIIMARNGEPTLAERLVRDFSGADDRIDNINLNLDSRGVSLLNYKHLATELNDWTLALQTALNENDTVYIPKADHDYLLGQITLNSNNVITSNFAEVKRNEVTTYGNVFHIPESSEDVLIERLIINGNKQVLGLHDTLEFVEIAPNGKNVILQNLKFINTIRGVVSTSLGRNVIFRDSSVDTFRGHVFYGSTNSNNLLAENIVSHNDDMNRGAYKVRDGTKNMTIRGCKHYGTGSFLQLDTRGGGSNHNVTIENCYAEVDYDALTFQSAGTANNFNVSVINSVFTNTGTSARSYINLAHNPPPSVDGLTIRDCHFYNFSGEFSFKGGDGVGKYNKNILIDNNHFYARDYENVTSTRPMFSLSNCINVTCTNNKVFGSDVGIYHSPGAMNTIIKNNTFRVNKAIYLSPNSNYHGNNFIDGNIFICSEFITGLAPTANVRRKLFIRDNQSSTLTSPLDITTWGERVVMENNIIGD